MRIPLLSRHKKRDLMIRLFVLSILFLVTFEQLQCLLILPQVLIAHRLVEGDLFFRPVIGEGKSRLRVLQRLLIAALSVAAIIQRL